TPVNLVVATFVPVNPQPTLALQEGGTFSGTVFTVADANPFKDQGPDTPVIINWGDGTTSVGGVVHTGFGTFSITGTHQYLEEGTPVPSVTLSMNGVAGSPITNPNVTVNDAPLTASRVNIPSRQATEGFVFTGTVASFTDADPNGQAPSRPGSTHNDYAITISWGDGATSTGTAVFDGVDAAGSHFHVTGSHAYLEEGVYV